ncbi:ATP-binding response regulator [Gracilimonas mengyeensis]|nr:response regulator [Gracilimonas mengyeensis]
MKNKRTLKITNLVEQLSHELRTPLNAILGYSELLKKGDNLNDEQKAHLEKISTSGNRLVDVINDIIEISNIEAGQTKITEQAITCFELTDQLNEKFAPLFRRKELSFEVLTTDHPKAHFLLDVKKLKTILYSLLNNALKFTDSGSVQVNMDLRLKSAANSKLVIEVTDTGTGLTNKELEHIFEPFWQANVEEREGTGLGLTTVWKLVNVLGGTINVKSKHLKGSTFKVSLPVTPLTEEEMRDRPAGNILEEPKRYTRNISSLKALIVDDMAINRTLARIMLQMNNFSTIEASNGVEALDHYLVHQPDVILMDISMPEMDGIEAMEKIRSINGEGQKTPIIAITAGGHNGTPSDLMNLGFSEYIQKPYKEKELFDKISLFLPLNRENGNGTTNVTYQV